MTVNQVIWIMWFLALVYYGLARTVLAKINKQDPDYFELGGPGQGLPFGIKTSMAIWDMIWDSDLPGDDFGNFVKRSLYVVRVMLALYIPFAAILFYNANWN